MEAITEVQSIREVEIAPRLALSQEDVIMEVSVYEGKLAHARGWARTVGILESVCRFLAYCNLTWATVVLLGGFVSNLGFADFRIVTILLLLEAGRALFSTMPLRKALLWLRRNPILFNHEYRHPILATARQVLSQIGQTIFISPSIVLPIIRLAGLVNPSTPNLLASLQIFYILALINAAIGLAAVVVSIWFLIFLFDGKEQSIERYYDEVLQRTLDTGMVQADDFDDVDFFDFAFKVLGKEFARKVEPPTVREHHRQLLEYMRNHPEGVNFLQIYLDRENPFVQQAAVNMVGFWALDNLEGVKRLPMSLLTKLADKLQGPGQVSFAAANSFNALTKVDPHLVLGTTGIDKTTVLATLMELVDPLNSQSMVFVRLLISLVSVSKDTMRESSKLVEKLQAIFEQDRIHRLRLLAGYLLLKMEMLSIDEAKASLIEAIDPTEDYYINSEFQMLNELRERVDLPPLERNTFKVRDDS